MNKHLLRRTGCTIAALAMTISMGACGAKIQGDSSGTGPIKIWLSNNEQEATWGKDMVKAWNEKHPDQKITAQEIPASSSSEEAITAAITAGTAPCLVYNISAAAVPGWVRQGGLVDLGQFDGANQYITERSGDGVNIYQTDGKYYQMPWKSNPVMVMYNKDIFSKAGIDADNPNIGTFDGFLDAARKIVSSGAAQTAIWPAPTNEFYQPWFDFYPTYLAETDGTPLTEDGKATFNDEAGKKVATFWKTIYDEKLASQEKSTDDAMSTGKTAMQMAGPWAIASYKDTVNAGVAPVPTSDGKTDPYTYADAKNVSMFTTCAYQQTAWEFLKFTTSEDADGKLLEATGQMPLRKNLPGTYAEYFQKNPAYEVFAKQAEHTSDVPSLTNSTEVWQEFRKDYSAAVIFGKGTVDEFLDTAATNVDKLLKQN